MFSRFLLLVLSTACVAHAKPYNLFQSYDNYPLYPGYRVPIVRPNFNHFNFPSFQFPQFQFPNFQFPVQNFPFPHFPQLPNFPLVKPPPGPVANEEEFKYVIIVGPFKQEEVTTKVEGRYVYVDAKHKESGSSSAASGVVYVPPEYDLSKLKVDVVDNEVIVIVPAYPSTETSNEKEPQSEVTVSSEENDSKQSEEQAEPMPTAPAVSEENVQSSTPVAQTE